MKKRIYTVATTHLDTTWSWTLETTLNEYLPRTLRENFERFEQYPDYVFNFEGSYRYELMQEYDPEAFEKVKEYVRQGRWNVAGSCYENGDVNIPSPEAIFRNLLLGNNVFEDYFGKRCNEVYLPDCFGFGYALPSVIHHAGLKGFTTQKLAWSCAGGIPFDLGYWQGPDGSRIFASLDARDYNYTLKRVRRYQPVRRKLISNTLKYNLPFTVVLHGIGDRGGAPREPDVKAVCSEARQNDTKKTDVLLAKTGDIFDDMEKLGDTGLKKLPVWNSELVFTDHGVGCYTSRTVSKRWNRRCEQLAACAEQSACMAHVLGLGRYPQEKLTGAWKRVIAHQFHDDLTGTSLEDCYKRNWNDYVLSMNEFSEEYTASCGVICGEMDTAYAGDSVAVAVSNPLQFRRREAVSAEIEAPWDYVRVLDPQGKETPSQITRREKGKCTVVFMAAAEAFGYSIYQICPAAEPCRMKTGLSAGSRHLENKRYSISMDEHGDISGIFDKKSGRQLLKEPVRMALFDYEGSQTWPAWELNYKECMRAPKAYPENPVWKLKEQGPARVAVETVRTCRNSVFRQTVFLDACSDFIRVENEILWQSLRTLLKTEFPLAASNPKASYDLGFGVIERGNNTRRLYEVPAQQWADITDTDENFGVSVFSDSRCGWDKPKDNTFRLTGVYSSRIPFRANMHLMDFGINRYGFGISGHGASWRAQTSKEAAEFNQPMHTFIADKKKGSLGKGLSFLRLNTEKVIVRGVKKAERSNQIVVRVNECAGERVDSAELTFCKKVTEAYTANASEQVLGGAQIKEGRVLFDMKPYEMKTFLLTFEETKQKVRECQAVALPYNADVISGNQNRRDGSLPDGHTIPAELLPETLFCAQIPFAFGDKRDGRLNGVLCDGQVLTAGKGYDTMHLLMASFEGDREADFYAGGQSVRVTVRSAQDYAGTWDLYAQQWSGYIKKEALAIAFTHCHLPDGDDRGKMLHFFRYEFPLSAEGTLKLPADSNIVILSACATKDFPKIRQGDEQYDSLEKREIHFELTEREKANSRIQKLGRFKSRMKFLLTFARNRTRREIEQFLWFR